MSNDNPLEKAKKDYQDVVDLISSKESAVGIDAQYTHAIIIEYLKQISDRLEKIEQTLNK